MRHFFMWDTYRICMEDAMINEFYGCYKMQQADIERFAQTLADGFRGYALFEHVCNGKYSYEKMKAFWIFFAALHPVTSRRAAIRSAEAIRIFLVVFIM